MKSGPLEEIPLSGADMIGLVLAVHEKGAAFRFKAAGSSMKPFIRSGDVLTLSPLQGLPPLVGEVVAFRHPQTHRLMVHRVVRRVNDSYFIKGDNLKKMDAHIPLDNILGVVTKVERKDKAIFWPNRFHHFLLARLYFKGYPGWLHVRRFLKNLLRPIVSFFLPQGSQERP